MKTEILAIFALAGGLPVAGCARGVPRVSIEVPRFDKSTMVTPSLARLLDSNGQMPNREAPVAGAISSSRASELAERYIRLFGPTARTWLEGLHGRSLDFASLRADGAVILSESPFEPLDASVPPPARKRAGPYYVVTLHSSDGPALSVAVSAFSSDIDIDSAGVRSTAPIRGNDFLVWPVPRRGRAMPALSAGEAIATAFRAFGEQVDALPAYERKGIDFLPQEGAWRISLAHPVDVRLRSGNEPRRTQIVYVLDAETIAIAVEADSSEQARQFSRARAEGVDEPLRYRSGVAHALAQVRPRSAR